jgi:hypothetical protein
MCAVGKCCGCVLWDLALWVSAVYAKRCALSECCNLRVSALRDCP